VTALDDILAGYEALRPAQEAFYQDLHRHPELSHHEHDTARRVAGQLQGDGFAVTAGIGGTPPTPAAWRWASTTPAVTTCTWPP